MSAFHNTCPDGEQSRAYEGAARPAPPLVDRTTAEWFFRTVDERAAAAAIASGIENGVLMLSSFGELPGADDAGTWKSIPSGNRPFALGEHRAMAAQAVAWAEQPGRNVYVSMAVYPRGLGVNKRGKASDALGVSDWAPI